MRLLKNSDFLSGADIRVCRTIQNESMLEHNHEFVEIFYCVSGTGTHEIGGSQYPIVSGGVYIIEPFTPHKICTDSHTDHYDILIDKSYWDKNQKCLEFSARLGGVYLQGYDAGRGATILGMIEEEQQLPLPSRTFIEELFLAILALIERAGDSPRNTATDRVSKPQIIDYVNKHCCENITLSDIAQLYGYNSSYLSRYFRQMCGMSYSEYLTRLRMNRAKSLLKNTNYSISQIARMLGYQGNSQFYVVFSKHYGISPNRFRIEYHREKLRNNIEPEDGSED